MKDPGGRPDAAAEGEFGTASTSHTPASCPRSALHLPKPRHGKSEKFGQLLSHARSCVRRASVFGPVIGGPLKNTNIDDHTYKRVPDHVDPIRRGHGRHRYRRPSDRL
jgi:hypothetical protein